jgi:cobalt-precorrin-5B (C1)-methyltransferase
MIDMGDFAGGMLKYLRRHPIPRVVIGGGFAKISKLAEGNLDLHSGRSQVDFTWLADVAHELGASKEVATQIEGANTAAEALSIATTAKLDLAPEIARRAQAVARYTVGAAEIEIDVFVYDRSGNLVGRSDA